MTYPLEVKYISINWAAKNTIRSIVESRDLIELEKIDKEQYKIEAITYSKIDGGKAGQLAFHIPDYDNTYMPLFIKSSGEKEPLISIKDDETGKTWWVENGKWKKFGKKVYRDSPLCRHAGEAKIMFGDILCQVQIRSLSFTYDELNLYLSDFRNDLWDLILNENSYISANAKNHSVKVAKKELFEYLNTFIKCVNKILINPKKELRESQSLQVAEKVRPIPRTFMEIVTKGHSKLLTGRDYIESYNVAENRYIYGIVSKISILLDNLSKVSEQRKFSYKQHFNSLNERLNNFSDTVTIDKDVLENEINDINYAIRNEKEKITISLSKQLYREKTNYNQSTLFVKLGKKGGDYQDDMQFWGQAKLNQEDDWYKFDDSSSLSLIFNKESFNDVLTSYYEYKITSYIDKEKHTYQKEGKERTIYKRHFKDISKIEITYSPLVRKLDSLLSQKEKLKKKNWVRPLNRQEREEQEKEKESIRKSLSLLSNEDDKNKKIFKSLIPTYSKIKKIEKQLLKLKIKKDYHFPGSMTFIQNPNYQGAHKLFKKIMNSSGLDDNLFDSLQEAEKIGVLDIPAIYERWCLLQIIKVLIEKYNFIPEEGWKQSLLNQVLTTRKNIVLNFQNDKTDRKICLSYEKKLSNGKRPDFVLDVTSSFSGNDETHRFIMDAKFYEKINISKVVDELYNSKDYSEGNINKVFILHPAFNAVPKRKTPQEWSKNSYYGETSMFRWEETEETNPPDHKYGAILLSPIKKEGASLDDLQRLIGMFLQYGMEDNSEKDTKDSENEFKFNPMVKKKLFCIACGSDEYSYQEKSTPRGKKWLITCNNCTLLTVYNYCGSCHNRLIKSGQYWTYHATQALEPFNIKCPSCGDIATPRN